MIVNIHVLPLKPQHTNVIILLVKKSSQLHPKTKTKISLKKSPKTFQNNKNKIKKIDIKNKMP
jgi:hypothetical protein